MKRKTLPNIWTDITYCAKLQTLDRELLYEIPYLVPWQRSIRDTNRKAIARCGLIFSYLQYPDEPEIQQDLITALGQGSYDLLREFWATERITEFALECDGEFIQQVRRKKGAIGLPGFTTSPLWRNGEGLYVRNTKELAGLAI